ncbi:MAG: AraC family transcriptional regulator [Candidatus Obscuribacterales bacterium]|nr:AraC family transcriptional regulator [Cyanobacteria bacterium SZAS LIN-5]
MNAKNSRFDANQKELVEKLAALTVEEGTNCVVDNLECYRWSNPTAPKHGLYSPSMCVIAQGAKEVTFGEERLRYDPANYLLISMDIPVVSQVVEATPAKPYLGFKLEFDPTTIASVIVETGISAGRNEASVKSMAVGSLQDELLDALLRLFRLTDNSDDYRVISPMVMREIIYRLLKSDQGPRLRQMAVFGGNAHRITKAVQILRSKYNQNINIEGLAQELGMSVSSFHQHFKTATSMSPLQFQKTLRLQEARRLLLTEDIDASTAAEMVGYDDASQFSREYKRTFGEPPKRDVGRFKQLASA